jgi:hypothetical protein
MDFNHREKDFRYFNRPRDFMTEVSAVSPSLEDEKTTISAFGHSRSESIALYLSIRDVRDQKKNFTGTRTRTEKKITGTGTNA